MTKPVLLAVDDDLSVLSAISRDLRRRYAEQYRVLRADSGAAGLEALRELKQRNDPVALFLVDQRMPHMSGVEFLEQARPLYPEAKRVLLTAYADTDAAIQAINNAAIHYYLLKPWDPPEEKLYPTLDDLLDDWQANYHPPFSGIRIIGHRWSPEAHQLKDFLARNHVPYQYLDVEFGAEARQVLSQLEMEEAKLPVVILPNGESLASPSLPALAEKVGLKTQAERRFYDLAIVGGGPAGLAAAVYGASEGLRTVLIEREATGGQAGTSSRIENYLGFPSGLSGAELARRATTQAKRFGVEILAPQKATGVRVDGPYRMLTLADGSEISCHVVVVAVGLTYRKLNVPGIDKLTGAGVYYGASLTEASLCEDQPVLIVGAGNSAGQAALYLAQTSSKVIMLVRDDSLGKKMSQYLVERIEATPTIEVLLQAELAAVHGEEHLEAVTVRHHPAGTEETLPAVGLFVFIGATPCTDWLRGVVKLDERGFILTGPQLLVNAQAWPLEREPFLTESSIPGIFAIGDVRANSVKRVASAVGEGSITVQFVHQYLSKVR
ncbi:MAG: fused response regulator/thioredoxin-disulfide reductase [Chloroflexota bacterium]|nr:MAG: fused response regulator/thioredoxin-disulfide reductase [Chloroflexota bacterium]